MSPRTLRVLADVVEAGARSACGLEPILRGHVGQHAKLSYSDALFCFAEAGEFLENMDSPCRSPMLPALQRLDHKMAQLSSGLRSRQLLPSRPGKIGESVNSPLRTTTSTPRRLLHSRLYEGSGWDA